MLMTSIKLLHITGRHKVQLHNKCLKMKEKTNITLPAGTVPKYHTVGTVPNNHTVGTVHKYHTVGTVPKYHTVVTVPKYHTVGTVPIYNGKIVERVAKYIPCTLLTSEDTRHGRRSNGNLDQDLIVLKL